jgi:microcystin degradation protein MlrC
MRILIAMIKHETNTFSPVPTGWQRFEDRGLYLGAQAIEAYEGTGTPFAAYLRLAREAGADVVTPVAAEAMPSGPVSAQAYDRLSDMVCEAVASGCDAAMLDLHGAMVSETTPDGEGALVERMRRIAPGLPIAVTCDLHCNLTQRLVDHCTALVGYKTYPHVDMYDAGLQAGRILLRALEGDVRPVMAWGSRPLLAQTLRMGTDDEPMVSLVAMARQAEAQGALAATVFGGFPLADIKEAGVSAVVVADGDPDAALAWVDRLLDRAWARREEFIYHGEALPQAVARAKALPDGPILLLDHADNCASGGTQDVMTVIGEVIAQGLENVAVAAVWDPGAVGQMIAAGVGSEVTIDLGGKTDMPAIGLVGQPLRVRGRVRTLSDGEWIVTGPMYTGVRVSVGPTAVLDAGNVQIVVISHHHEPWDQGIFTRVGIDPATKKVLVLKSRIHYRAGFGPLARHTISCDGAGVASSDNSLFDYVNVRRPIYPLDRFDEA